MTIEKLIEIIREQRSNDVGDYWFVLNDSQCKAVIQSYVRTHASEFWGVKDS